GDQSGRLSWFQTWSKMLRAGDRRKGSSGVLRVRLKSSVVGVRQNKSGRRQPHSPKRCRAIPSSTSHRQVLECGCPLPLCVAIAYTDRPIKLHLSSAPSLTLATSESSLRPMSGLPFELLLALRYLRPKRTFVSFITLISVLGVSLGVAVLIIVISVMSGFDQQLREKILGFNTHLKIFKRSQNLKDYERIASLVA